MRLTLNDLGDMITAAELGYFLKFGYAKALDFIKYSGIPYNKIGNAYRVSKQDLQEFLANNQDITTLD